MIPALYLALAVGGIGSFCDPMWLPNSRPVGAEAVVIRFGADSVADIAAPKFAPRGPVHAWEESLKGNRGPTRPRFGQRGTLVEASPATERSRGAPVVLVPWDFVEDCDPAPWTRGALWTKPGTEGFVVAWLRPESAWIDGLPTFDVEVRGWEPIWQRADPRWRDRGTGDGPLLNPREFQLIYQGLPTHPEVGVPATVKQRVAAIRHRYPELANREPARTMLANLDRVAAGQ